MNFSEYFILIREETNLRKVSKLLYILLIAPDKVEKRVHSDSSDSCIRHYNVEVLNIF